MSRRSVTIGLLAAVAAALVAWALLDDGNPGDPGEAVRRAGIPDAGPPRLQGTGAPAEAVGDGEGPDVDAAATGEGEAASREHCDLEVLDYRGAGVSGVRVFLEYDIWDHLPAPVLSHWGVLAEGTTDERGHARLLLPVQRRVHPGQGENLRVRVEPPAEREDLSPTWRLWKPESRTTIRLVQTHVLEGRVLDRNGEPIWAATVWYGRLPGPSVTVNDPAWGRTTTDPSGHFRFAGIPTTADWRIDVWAVAPGQAEPKSSREIRGGVEVALDTRAVEIRLE